MEMLLERPGRERQNSLEQTSSGRSSSIDDTDDVRDMRVPHTVHFSTRKEDREREKALQKKLGELTTQIQRLERRISLLRTENETLRKKQDDQRPLEEKIKSLKKRNAELASIARRLEEKAKALQQENSRVRAAGSKRLSGSLPGVDETSISTTPTHSSATPTPDSDHLRRVVARQRARDLAEHAKAMLAKDREIEELRRKCQDLADQLSNGDISAPHNSAQFEEKEELVNIIKQAAKERLQLEQQLGHTHDGRDKIPSREEALAAREREEQQTAERKRREELEAANQILHQEIEKLEAALHKAEVIDKQLAEKSRECEALNSKLNSALQQKAGLEKQVASAQAKEATLQAEVQGLKVKVEEATKVTEECNALKLSLASVQKEREAAQQEVTQLNLRVHSLENLVRDLQESAERTSVLDNERRTILSQLQERQAQIDRLQKTKSDVESGHVQTVSALTLQVQELEERRRQEEQRRREEEERREGLAREVERLKAEAEERQKVVEEAERLKEELAAKQLEAATALAVAKTQSALSASGKTRGSDADDGRKLDVREGMERKTMPQGPVPPSLLNSWVQKGPIQVYLAKYNYDPSSLSPNDNPEMELPLTAGDYVLVVGDMDEDGFYEGELIDGRRGLVPSNFIEMVEDEDLVEFHSALMQAGHGDYGNSSNISNLSIASNNNSFSTISNNNNNNIEVHGAKSDLNNGGGVMEEAEDVSSDLEDIAELDEDNASVNSRVLANGGSSSSSLPPCPRGLSLDRALTSSLLMSWSPPEPQPGLEVHSYHVMVDGLLNTSVKVTERTKALLEGVGLDQNHRVCVRCLSNRGQSKDAQCTMLVGKDVYPTPTELKVGHVTPTSAVLSWLPGNSNYQHSISVNGREVRVVKPGIFRYTLTGLTPGTLHKVSLMAKSISGALNEEKSRKYVENVSASIDFTTPVAGAPDPPLNVQVESGPRQGTLLVSWLPVTLSSSGISNGATVSGYHVIADGTRVKVAAGPTTDHVILSAIDLKGAVPERLWVRTVSGAGVESGNSEQIVLPAPLAKEVTGGQVRLEASSRPGAEEGHKGADTDEEIEAAFREAQHTNGIDAAAHADHFSDSSSSELSDIPEVEEDLIGSTDSHLNEVGRRLSNHTPELSQVTSGASPKPAPRKSMGSRGKGQESQDSGPREFHAQKPSTTEGSNLLATPSRMVPAIEITRDSSTERAMSQEESTEENRASSSSPSRRNTPTSSTKSRPPPGDPSVQNAPSAFRHVGDQPSKPSQQQQGGRDSNKDKTSVPSTSGSPSHHQSRHDSPSNYASPSRRQQGGKAPGPAPSSHSSTHYPNPQHHPPHSHAHLAAASDDRDLEGNSEADVGGDSDSISGELNHLREDHQPHPPVDPSSIRLFIALFDYDPMTMSPNIDCVDEELPFREGQIIRVVGDKDSDGFYKGELAGRAGLVPCNMVSEVRIDDPELVEQLLQEAQGAGGTQVHPVNSAGPMTHGDPSLTPNGVPPLPRAGPMKRMVAMYDYDPQELSPNVDAELELSFKTGDTVLIYGEMDEDGFYTGEVRGQRGLVPSNFLQPAPVSDEEEGASDGGPGGGASVARSRSGESLDNALSALGGMDPTTSANHNSTSKPMSEASPTRAGSRTGSAGSLSAQQTITPPLAGTSGAGKSRHAAGSPGSADGEGDGKAKKKSGGGFLNRLKKLTR